MTRYMVQFSYGKEAVAGMLKKPEDRTAAVGEVIEQLGGRLLDLYYTFGDYDGFVIAELPDNVTALAADIASVAPGHLSKLKTTVLLTPQDMVAAMQKAGQVGLRPPGA